jgi:8-oxo-dGTP pyrophosphatase MutT (NUDIX family)
MKKEDQHKVLAIPVTFTDGKPKFLTVRDRRFKEWLFISGGCRKREILNPIRCALRELEEETRGTVNIKSGVYTTFDFETDERSPEELIEDMNGGVKVNIIYHVYIFFVQINSIEQQELIRKFNREKYAVELRKKEKLAIKRTYDENDFMSFDTLETFNRKNRWDLIVKNVINNPNFYEALNSLNRKNFNIRIS